MEGITVHIEKIDHFADAAKVVVVGYIDTATSSVLEKELSRLSAQDSLSLFMDLSSVDYISSAGWGVFIEAIRRIREKGGDIKLVGMQSDVQDVFELLEFQSILESYESMDEALGVLQKS